MSSSKGIDRREALRRVGILLGGLVSAPTAAGVLGGCKRTSNPDWTPEALTAEQDEMVDTIAEIIIPATDTPGARAANVNRFVDAMLTGSYPPETRDRFLVGLDETNARCQDTYGRAFVECALEEQRVLVGELDNEETDEWGIPLLRTHVSLTDNAEAMREDMKQQAAEMLEAAGATEVEPYEQRYWPGEGIHEMGGARMGRDPNTSVLNAHNQAHDVPNLFVTDGACMTSASCQNPSITYMALTARAVDYAVKEMRQGTL